MEQARALLLLLAAGLLVAREFGERFALLLQEAHTEAVVIGRHHAGDTAPLEEDDRAFAASVMDGEAEFLAGFVKDLETDRYRDDEGEFRLSAVEQRSVWYTNKLVASASEAWALTLPPDTTLLYWLLSGGESCPDCVTLHSRSPWRVGELEQYPADGSTICGTNCRCVLQTASGQTGFSVP